MLPLSTKGLCDRAPNQAHFTQLWHPDAHAIRAEIIEGLLAPQAAVAPKYFYDSLGSRLFEAICALPEYYLTRTEAAIIESNLVQIARAAGRGCTLIDLGAGNCAKAARLFPALQPTAYAAVDISVDFLRDAVDRLRERFPGIAMSGIGVDFSQTLELPGVPEQDRLFFYPGSSIGNFHPEHAAYLLKRIRAAAGVGGGVLIGVDLLKDPDMLKAAYDDALGVTAAFNRNLLLHLNRLIGADFALADWDHLARFNPDRGCIEMHLQARRDLRVHWNGGARAFVAGQTLHTECSYKYTRGAFLSMLEEAGFRSIRSWCDASGWFMVCHARAA